MTSSRARPKVILETERLRLRAFVEADADRLFELNSDPDVMRYIAGGQIMDRARCDATLRRMIELNEELDVLGIWAAELKGPREFVGWFALKVFPDPVEIELVYRLLKRHWGRGYATEGARALVAYGAESAGLRRIVAVHDPANAASRRVLEKAGLHFERTLPFTSPTDGVTRPVDYLSISTSGLRRPPAAPR